MQPPLFPHPFFVSSTTVEAVGGTEPDTIIGVASDIQNQIHPIVSTDIQPKQTITVANIVAQTIIGSMLVKLLIQK